MCYDSRIQNGWIGHPGTSRFTFARLRLVLVREVKQHMNMKTRSLRLRLAVIPVLALLGGCGGSNTTPPSTVPSTPVTTPTTTQPPITALCTDPTPPPLHGIAVKVQNQVSANRWQLDSRPTVENVDGYCQKVGLGSFQTKYCDTRPEGNLQREACDAMAVGKAKDTGRYGPTWYYNDKPCIGAGDLNNGCINHDSNQFLVVAKGAGNYQACAADNVPVLGDRCGGLSCPGPGC